MCAAAVVVAAGLSLLWWGPGDAAATRPPPQGVGERSAAAPAAVDVAQAREVVGGGRSGDAVRRGARGPRSRARALSITVERGAASMSSVPVELLFVSSGEPLVRQGLRVGRSGEAAWDPGSPATWPFAADLGFPTSGAALVELADTQRATLRLPDLGALSVQVLEVDGLASTEPATAEVRAASAGWPADRWHRRALERGRCRWPVEVGAGLLEVRVVTASQREVTTSLRAPDSAGEETTCALRLPAAAASRFAVRGLPERAGPWLVELFGADGSVPVRAPRDGEEHLSFARPDAPGVQPCDDGGLVLARCGDELWWGVLAARVAAMSECVPLARGQLVGADARGLVGAPLELIERGSAGQRVLLTIRTGRDGAFVILGPDHARVPVALRVPATGEVVALPQRASLQLRAGR